MLFIKIKIEVKKQNEQQRSISELTRSLFLWLCGIAVFIYVGIEVSMYGWLPTLWENKIGYMMVPASYMSTIFWLFLTSGRLFLGKLVDALGYKKYLLISAFLILALSVIWFFITDKLAMLIIASFIGLTLSCIFPSLIGLGNQHFTNNSGLVSAFLITFASWGGFLVPSGIGKIMDHYQTGVFPLIVVFLAVFFVLVILVLAKGVQQNSKK